MGSPFLFVGPAFHSSPHPSMTSQGLCAAFHCQSAVTGGLSHFPKWSATWKARVLPRAFTGGVCDFSGSSVNKYLIHIQDKALIRSQRFHPSLGPWISEFIPVIYRSVHELETAASPISHESSIPGAPCLIYRKLIWWGNPSFQELLLNILTRGENLWILQFQELPETCGFHSLPEFGQLHLLPSLIEEMFQLRRNSPMAACIPKLCIFLFVLFWECPIPSLRPNFVWGRNNKNISLTMNINVSCHS